ncbi:HD domain-containing protein [Cytophagaceae bacterium ABcell3]|nr:HD domain-containing protein [Cytophagaceae bacterium ABcell3]
MEDILEKIRSYADRAHGDQKRKYTGERYIVHPVRVMNICREYTDELPVLAAALLHDVLEDTPVTAEELSKYLHLVMSKEDAEKTLFLTVELTDIFVKEDYPKLNRKKRKFQEAERLSKTSPEAQTIKYADAIDNSLDITKNDLDFARTFLRENKQLLESITKGNQELYHRAVKTVDECIEEVDRKTESS